MFYPDYDPRDPYNRRTSSENNWIRVQMEDDGASNDQRDCKLNHPMHDDAARQEELEILSKIGSKGAPSFSVLSPSKPSKQLCRPEEVVHDILHQLRVQMEPGFVHNFIASLTPASRDWISANEDQVQAKVAEVLRSTGMSLDQLKAILDSNAKK
jgi:hypothetical protein